ncbi:MAG TPA: PAS domain S-box protein, partial [Burkholderiales bacterium]
MSPDQQLKQRFSDDQLLGSLFAQEATGIAVTTLEGRFLKVNRALCGMTGYSEAELLELTFREITHPEDIESNENLR